MPEEWYVPVHDFDLHRKRLDHLHGVYPRVHLSLDAGEFAMGLVEICLTSNDLILGVRGQEHPLPAYLGYGVPIALTTDDQGVSRSDMTPRIPPGRRNLRPDLCRLASASRATTIVPGYSRNWSMTLQNLSKSSHCELKSGNRELL